METKEIVKLWNETIEKFGVNEYRSVKLYINNEVFLDSSKQDIKPAHIRAFMYLVAGKQIPMNSVFIEDDYGKKSFVENGKLDYDFAGRWFSADDNIAFAQFELEDEY